jgi:hypothetical protein
VRRDELFATDTEAIGKRAEGRRNMKEALSTTKIIIVDDSKRLERGSSRPRRSMLLSLRELVVGGRSPQSRRKIGRELWALLRYGILSKKSSGGWEGSDHSSFSPCNWLLAEVTCRGGPPALPLATELQKFNIALKLF